MKETLKIKNEQGQEIEADILFTFESENTNQKYVTYTDYSKDENGNIKCFSSIQENEQLLPVTTEFELEFIDKMLKTLTKTTHEKYIQES